MWVFGTVMVLRKETERGKNKKQSSFENSASITIALGRYNDNG